MKLAQIATLYPPFGGTGTAVLPTFRAALRTRIFQEVPGFGAVKWDKAGELKASDYPLLMIYGGDEDAELNTTDSYWERMSLQFSVYSEDKAAGVALRDAVWQALRPVAANPPIVFRDGYEMTRIPVKRYHAREQPGRGPKGAQLWMADADFIFLIGRE